MKKLLLLALSLCFFATTIFASKPQKPLIVALDWFLNPNHAPLLVAEEEGFFKQQGVEVKLIAPADASEGEKMVAAGKADIAISYQPTLLYKVTNGLPLVRFATLISQPLNCLVVLSDNGINSIKDLKHKRIGYSTPGTDNIMLTTMLKSAAMSIDDVEMINVRFDLMQALLSKKIDGFTGGMRNLEPLAIKQAGQEVKTFYPENYGFPTYEELIFVTNKNESNDPRLAKFVAAITKGAKFLRQNPQISWDKVVLLHPELNNELNKKVWLATVPYFTLKPGKLNKPVYEHFAKFMQQQRLISYIPKISTYTIEYFLP